MLEPMIVLALLAAGLTIAAAVMQTMIPLRYAAIAANLATLLFEYLSGATIMLALQLALLPINLYRLAEMRRLVRRVHTAADQDLAVDWLRPFMAERRLDSGQIVFRKGEPAGELYFVTHGRVRLLEINEDLGPGQLLGEIGFFAPDNTRALTAECVGDCTLHVIGASAFRQLFFQNPEFGYYVVRLIARRLSADIARAEARNRYP